MGYFKEMQLDAIEERGRDRAFSGRRYEYPSVRIERQRRHEQMVREMDRMSNWNGSESTATAVREPGTVATLKRILITRWNGRERKTEEAGEWLACRECRESHSTHRHNVAIIAVPSEGFDKEAHWYFARLNATARIYECPCEDARRRGQGCKHQCSVNNLLNWERLHGR